MAETPAPSESSVASSDGPDRRERLLNLLALLIETRTGLRRDEITSNPTLGYPASAVAARRAFERDKATLRAMGVPIRDVGDDAETRYRVDPKEYYLPDLGLTEDELAALHVAVTAIGLGSNAGEGALMKLGGIEGSGSVPVAELPFSDVLVPLFDASRRRSIVHFSYRGRLRTLEPWGLTSKFGNWYVVGFDHDADDMRVFRADRIEDDIEAGAPGAFTVPADFRADTYLEDRPWDYGEGRATDVVVRVDPSHEVAFLQAAGGDARAEHQDDGSTLVTIRAVEVRAVVNFVLGFLDRVEIVAPPEARAMIVEALEARVA
ncbi:MAG: helix-turn-helix transcriptional regulator [Acidimicrobiia bacterium]